MGKCRWFTAAAAVVAAIGASHAALAQKMGGTLKLADPGSPANMSILAGRRSTPRCR